LPEPSPSVAVINTVAQVMKILAGIVSDSGGAGLPLGVPFPIGVPPWGPNLRSYRAGYKTQLRASASSGS